MTDAANDIEVATYKWYSEKKKNYPNCELSEEITSRLNTSTDFQERQVLYGLLASEHQHHRRDDEAEQVILEEIQEFPNSPRARIRLSVHYFLFLEDGEKSIVAIEDAIVVARRSGTFYREALGNRARIGIKFKRHDILCDSIEKILENGWEHGQLDVGLERDFIDNAQPGSIPQELTNQYDQFYWKVKNRNVGPPE